jgi:amino acid transporter
VMRTLAYAVRVDIPRFATIVFAVWCVVLAVLVVTGSGGSDPVGIAGASVGGYVFTLLLCNVSHAVLRPRVKLLMTEDEERHLHGRSRRDVRVAVVELSSLAIVWETIVIAVADASITVTSALAMLAIIPLCALVGFLLIGRRTPV